MESTLKCPRRRVGSLASLVFAVALFAFPASAHAAFPGTNGKIVWVKAGGSNSGLWVMNADGTAQQNLGIVGSNPAWSPDGERIAYDLADQIYVANSDGSGATPITGGARDANPAWSPDGRKLVFARYIPSAYADQLYTVNADGTGVAPLGVTGMEPSWSPDGTKIVYSAGFYENIWVVHADGSQPTQLTFYRYADTSPNWSPDGSRIVYSRDVPTDIGIPREIAVMNADGSNQQLLTGTDWSQLSPAWSPDGKKILHVDTRSYDAIWSIDLLSGTDSQLTPDDTYYNDTPDWQPVLHDHPRSAASVSVSLVPMLRQTISDSQCRARGGMNSTHGPPLALPSCQPPGYLPGTLAKLGVQSAGRAQVTALPGDLSTPADEADVLVTVGAADVRDRQTGDDYDPSPAGADAGLSLLIRLSDTYNQPTGNAPATSQDFVLSIPVQCAASTDPGLGSDCSANTSLDALNPGAVREGKHTVMTVSRLWLYDSGLNGTQGNGDDRPFAQQGVYIP